MRSVPAKSATAAHGHFMRAAGTTSGKLLCLSGSRQPRWSAARRGPRLKVLLSAGARGRVHVARFNNLAEAAMHWRKAPSRSNSRIFYIVIAALSATLILTTALLVLHRV
jgi:hypothetical protein